MKKLVILIIALCMLMSSACAEFDGILLLKYNSAAQTSGAPTLKTENMRSNGDYYQFNFDELSVGFEMAPIGGVRTGIIFTDDDELAADFLCSCIAMTFTLGEVSTAAAGMIIMQYAAIRAGRESTPYNLGIDAFSIVSGELGKYTFVYMNNDATIK